MEPDRHDYTGLLSGASRGSPEAAGRIDIIKKHPSSHENVEVRQRSVDSSTHGTHRYWISTWLRKWTLIALVALFTAMCVSLLVLWRLNKSQNGFRTTLSTNHYAWTYGPTAILVVVLSLWRQVDYYCKVMQPWQVLHRGCRNAAQTVLLDYVAPLNITSFINAIRYRHSTVAASIAGFAVLKLLVVFSTGLLVLTPTPVSRMYPVTLTTRFDESPFWDTMTPTEYRLFSGDRRVPAYDNISSLPVHSYLGTLDGEHKFPSGTQDGKAFQAFQLIHPEDIADDFSTHVDVFNPNITCEIADVTWNNTQGFGMSSVQLKSATCLVGSADQTPVDAHGDSCRPSECQDHQIQYYFNRVNCSETVEPPSETYILLDKDTPYDLRYAIIVTNMTYEIPSGANDSSSVYPTPRETTAILCSVNYSIDKGTAEIQGDTLSLAAGELIPGQRLDNLTGLMLGEIIYGSLYETRSLLLDGMTGQDAKLYPKIETPLFYLLMRAMQGKQTLDGFLSAQVLQDTAVRVLGGIAAQFMRSFFMVPDDTEATANGSYTDERLHIALASLWAMTVCTLVLIVLTICIIWTRPGRIVPQPPDLISTNATILAASTGLNQILQYSGSFRTSQVTALLRTYTFRAHTEERFYVEATRVDKPEGDTTDRKKKKGAWLPLSARWYMVLLTFTAPLVAIVVLEILYQNSRHHQGLVDVTGAEDRASYLSRYLSALFMLLIATSFNALDFTIASFAPYSMLRSGGVTARRSLRFQILGEIPLVALWKSVRHVHLSSAFSNIAGLLGSVLTIIASGLWIIDRAVVTEHPIQASLAHSWNVSWHNSAHSGDGGSGAQLDLVQHGSSVMPTTIWQDFVLPTIDDIRLAPGSSLDRLRDTKAQNFTLTAGALRPVLSCEVVEDEHIEFSYGQTNSEASLLTIWAKPPLDPPCQRGGYNGTNKYYNLSSAAQPTGPDQLTWMGEFSDLHLGPWSPCDDCASEYHDYGEDYMNLWHMPDNPAGCPSIAMFFAKGQEDDTTHDEITVLLCSQRVEQVDLRITYMGGNTTQAVINPSIPPVMVNGSSRYLTNGTLGVDTFPYRPQTYLTTNSGNLSMFNANGAQQVLDEFTNHLVYGLNGTNFEDLAGKANRPTLIAAVQTLYIKYMSLVMDAKFRQPIEQGGKADMAVKGSVIMTTSRLKIDYTSKLVLQITLALITFFGALAFLLADLRGTLPRKPTSIASTMGFLAGSDICDEQKVRLPKNVELMSRKELDSVLDGWLFSLGWWGVSPSRPGSEGSEDLPSLQVGAGKERRFGIDIGEPEQLGFRETKWSFLRRRRFRSDRT
ncbi:unnamed protein product [Zymoseptoria tritici ST99CH_3D1]|nr:unnamed protein product [Zymoseptoria tritici ST99CH_3D1]